LAKQSKKPEQLDPRQARGRPRGRPRKRPLASIDRTAAERNAVDAAPVWEAMRDLVALRWERTRVPDAVPGNPSTVPAVDRLRLMKAGAKEEPPDTDLTRLADRLVAAYTTARSAALSPVVALKKLRTANLRSPGVPLGRRASQTLAASEPAPSQPSQRGRKPNLFLGEIDVAEAAEDRKLSAPVWAAMRTLLAIKQIQGMMGPQVHLAEELIARKPRGFHPTRILEAIREAERDARHQQSFTNLIAALRTILVPERFPLELDMGHDPAVPLLDVPCERTPEQRRQDALLYIASEITGSPRREDRLRLAGVLEEEWREFEALRDEREPEHIDDDVLSLLERLVEEFGKTTALPEPRNTERKLSRRRSR
jgi:hypothetical protein